MRQIDIADLRRWIEARFDAASGPGGQNVNKVSTRATLLFDFQDCPLFSDAERDRIARRCASRLAADGRLRVVAQQQRTQVGNRALAESRLVELLVEALRRPKTRRPTRPTAGSKRRRLAEKKRRGEIKKNRRVGPTPGE